MLITHQVVMEFFLIRMAEVADIYIEKVTITLINQIHKNPLPKVKMLSIINNPNFKVIKNKCMISQVEIHTEIKIQSQKKVIKLTPNLKKVKISLGLQHP